MAFRIMEAFALGLPMAACAYWSGLAVLTIVKDILDTWRRLYADAD